METQVAETRVSEDGDFIRRRRQCGACEKRFTTYERPDVTLPAVVKKDGRRIDYERAKVAGSMKLALRKQQQWRLFNNVGGGSTTTVVALR